MFFFYRGVASVYMRRNLMPAAPGYVPVSGKVSGGYFFTNWPLSSWKYQLPLYAEFMEQVLVTLHTPSSRYSTLKAGLASSD